MFRLLLITLFSALLCACVSKNTPLEFTDADAQSDNVVSVGQCFKVVLNSNPSTGYSWELVQPDSDILSLGGSDYVAPEKNVAGAPGKQVFYFRAERVGEQTLNFECRRSWEERKLKALQAVSFKFKVEN